MIVKILKYFGEYEKASKLEKKYEAFITLMSTVEPTLKPVDLSIQSLPNSKEKSTE